jgi:DamX protein
MAASALQDRLDYLVSYASQLIFINGETANQSSVLDTYISGSPEQVEIALLTASPTTVLAQYREKIYRQLVSQTQNADFNRPLNQLLVALNQHNGPLIISISKAENLPNKLLQELWELVLQSRFANNKQHLNVLLFAQGAWAKQARDQLQSSTGDKPLLLNNSANLPNLQQNTSELE